MGATIHIAAGATATSDGLGTHESDGLLWIHGIPKARTNYRGRVIPFDDPDVFDAVFSSLYEQIETGLHQPNYLIDAKLLGHQNGEGTKIIGKVVRVAKLDTADAIEHGVIGMQEDAGIFFGVELNDLGRELLDSEQLRFNSVGMGLLRADEVLDANDEPRRTWAAHLGEVSAVGKPHFKSLRPVEETMHLALNDGTSMDLTEEQITAIAAKVAEMVTPTITAACMEEMKAGSDYKMQTADGSDELAAVNQRIADATEGRAAVVAKVAESTGMDAEAVEAALRGDVELPPEVVAAVEAVLSAPMPEVAASDTDADALEVRALRAEVDALKQARAAERDAAQRKEARAEILAAATEEGVFLDLAASDNADLLDDLVEAKVLDADRFARIFGALHRDTRPTDDRHAGAGTVALQFSERPRTAEDVEANQRMINAYAAEHGVTKDKARAALIAACRN